MPRQCDQEDPVHDALQVRRRGHSYVGGALFDKTCEKAQQKQEHSLIVRAVCSAANQDDRLTSLRACNKTPPSVNP